jgi:hypothetical protein
MLVLISIPIVLGVIIAATKPEGTIAWINEKSAAATVHYNGLNPRWTIMYGWKAIAWCFHKLNELTAGILDDGYRAALRACLFFYVVAFCFYATLAVLYLILVFVVLAVGLWILSQISGGDGSSSYSEPVRKSRRPARPMVARRGTSRRREDWLGNECEEHRGEDGEIIARSRMRTDWLGNEYVETRDADGEVIETSRLKEDWLGNEFEEHRTADGERVGSSRDRMDWLGGEYVEHRDEDGDNVGESREREDWLGNPYTEHKS